MTCPRAPISLGGRFAFDDGGETPNTQVAVWDYQPVPMLCEVRNLKVPQDAAALAKYRGINRGVVVACEGGYYAGDTPGGAVFDTKDRKIKDFNFKQTPQAIEESHAANFIAAVKSCKGENLHADAHVGHVSASCLHLANVSYRLGKQTSAGAIADAVRSDAEALDAVNRYGEHLRAAGIEPAKSPTTLGPSIAYDVRQEQFTGPFAAEAAALSQRKCRAPYLVPSLV